jgi:excisionase family DNA binding protein
VGKVNHPRVPPPPPTLRCSEVAKLLHVSPKTVTRWARAGLLPPIMRTLGGHRRWDEAEIHRRLAELTYVPTREEATR